MNGFRDLLKCALPQGNNAASFLSSMPAVGSVELEDWLRAHPMLDWDKYASENTDIGQAGLDPVAHFLKHGIFEGRQLCTKATYTVLRQDEPVLTLMVYSHNHAPYLVHILNLAKHYGSALELIILEDASQDESRQILRSPANNAVGIKVVCFKTRYGRHLCRKQAIGLASGKYLLFLDLGDRLGHLPELFAEALKGGDLLLPGPEMAANSPDSISGKLIENGLAKRAFAQMADVPLDYYADIYENIVVSHKAKSTRRLDISAFSSEASPKDKLAPINEPFTPVLLADLENTAKMVAPEAIKKWLIATKIAALFALERKESFTALFDKIASQIGIMGLLDGLIDNYHLKWEQVAEQYRHYQLSPGGRHKAKRIGILYTMLGNGGAERVILEQVPLLLKNGYEVILFLGVLHENEEKLPKGIKVAHVGRMDGNIALFKEHLRMLAGALDQHPVDVMLCHAAYFAEILWQIIFLRHRGIPTILFMHSSFFRRLLHPGHSFSLQALAAILRCADKVVVLSRHEELYYRLLDVNAQYIPNPVRLPSANWNAPAFNARSRHIVAIGRMGEPNKNIVDCFRILREVIAAEPDVRLTFVGSLPRKEGRKYLEDMAAKYGVTDNIEVTDWLDDVTVVLDDSLVMLSTAWGESFSLTAAEAQARGIPVVMYDLPIALAEDNPAIIRLRHGAIKAVAAQIIGLLNDQNRWQKLSAIAMQKMQQFAPEAYGAKISAMLASFDQCSPISKYSQQDYRIVMKTLGFYGGCMPPWK